MFVEREAVFVVVYVYATSCVRTRKDIVHIESPWSDKLLSCRDNTPKHIITTEVHRSTPVPKRID